MAQDACVRVLAACRSSPATAFLGELDALTIRSNAEREALGHRMEAMNFQMGGQQAQRASRWNAVGTVLGTAGPFH